MVPLLSRRSLAILGIGLLVGILLGFGYWVISPAFSSGQDTDEQDATDAGLAGFLGLESSGPYTSSVNIQVANPGTDYTSLAVLQQIAEYYAAQYNSLPFFQFLLQELDKQPIDYTYTSEDLDDIITVAYDITTGLPAIKLTIEAETEEEVLYLIETVPQTFEKYLEEEQKANIQQTYDNTLQEIEDVKAALYDAQQELAELQSQEVYNNPSYISLSARVDALEQELNDQITSLSLEYLDDSDLQEEYEQTLADIEKVAADLAEAQAELDALTGNGTNTDSNDYAQQLILEATINALETELNNLISGTETQVGLTQMILDGIDSGIEYENLMLEIETAAAALAEAQAELDTLTNQNEESTNTSVEVQLAQLKVDTLTAEMTSLQENLASLYTQIIDSGNGSQLDFDRISIALAEARQELETLEEQLGFDRLAADTELAIAQEQVTNLNTRLTELTDQLTSLIGSTDTTLETGYLVTGNPSVPAAVMPQRSRARNTLLTGAIVGIVIAWVILNFRWLVALVSPSTRPKTEEEQE